MLMHFNAKDLFFKISELLNNNYLFVKPLKLEFSFDLIKSKKLRGS